MKPKILIAVNINYERDKSEMAIAREFIRLKKPIMGICRGHQLINVLFRGMLYQHIPNHRFHRGENGADAVHANLSSDGSFLCEMYGCRFTSNSMLHQAVKKVGEGLRVISAADDELSTVEALEHESLPIFSVQWHPEGLCFDKHRNDTVDGRYIFEHFIKMCK